MVSTALTATVGLPPGVHTLYAVIDPSNSVPESDESNNVISRSVRIKPFDPTFTPSQITTFTINFGADTADRTQVRLDLSATPSPAYVLYLEYQYIQSAGTWVRVASSGWLPYAAASDGFAWRLQPVPGVHYLQAWVADGNGNISPHPALAHINLLLPRAHLTEGEVHVYRKWLPAGASYLIRLMNAYGDADLYVWDPSGAAALISEVDADFEELSFSAPVSGTYQIEIEGYTAVDYRLETLLTGVLHRQQFAPQEVNMPNPRGRGVGLTSAEPGGDTGLPDAPSGYKIYLPVILR